jgi:ASPM-SPD-2-Hydin domain-containing protein
MNVTLVTLRGLVVAAVVSLAPRAAAISSYFGTQCAGCHSPAVVGSTATTCNGCHAHGAHPTSAKSTLNLVGTTNATSYAPGQTVSVTITGGYRTGWVRAVLFDQAMNQLAISTGPNGMGGGAGFPITLSAPAPTTTGSYTWSVAWYGNAYDAAAGAFGARWMDDPNNPDHGWEVVPTNAFTVSAPTAPAIALVPASLDFGSVTLGRSASLPAQVRNTGTANLVVSGIARCTAPLTEAEFSWTAPALPFTVAPGGAASVTVTFTALDPDSDVGCIAFTSNAANAPVANLAVAATGVAPPAPVADVSPLSLDFGAVTSGGTASRTFAVGNVGTATLTVAVQRAAGTSAEFTVQPASFTVPPGGRTTVTATYAPADVGTDLGTLAVVTNDPLQPSVPVTVSGTGVAAPVPHLALSPASLDLGGVTLGGSASLAAQVGNGGDAPLTVSAIARCAGTSAAFSWSPAAPFTVAPGGSTALTVTFAPTVAGAAAGCLAISSNDHDAPVTQLGVQGVGLAPAAPRIAVSPTALDLGSVTVGLTATRTLQVSNGGDATLTAAVGRAAGTSAEFTALPATLAVAPGGSQPVTVSYAPSSGGADTGAILITSNDPARPSVTVPVTGTGLAAAAPAIALDPPGLDFGPVLTGASASREVAIRNQGSAALQVTSITRCAGTSAEFTWSPGAPLQVPAGQAATLTVSYGPTGVGADTGCLAVASDDPASPMVNLALAGSGVAQAAPAIALQPDALDFGTVTVGGSATRASQVRNTGSAVLHVGGVAACAGTSQEFTWTLATPLELQPGGSATLPVVYTPLDAGADQGCLSIASDDPAHPTAALALAGDGAAPGHGLGDVDIAELQVPETVRTRTARSIVPRAELRNRSDVSATATATLKATLAGAAVYDQTVPVAIPAREQADLAFPPLALQAAAAGVIAWTLTVDDGDPDLDQARARTRVLPGRSGEDRLDAGAPVATAGAGSGAGGDGPAAGCATGGPSGSLGLLLALGSAALAPRRRRHG